MSTTGRTDPNGRAERRDTTRYPVLGELPGEVMIFQPMAITEIGRAGLQIETAFPLQLESLHDVRLAIGPKPLVVKARVTHCSIVDVDLESVRYRSGLQFVELPDRAAAAIREFVGRLADGRQKPLTPIT